MFYYMDKNADENNHRKVHRETCPCLPDSNKRMCLGSADSVAAAVKKGTKYFTFVDPCPVCCREEE